MRILRIVGRVLVVTMWIVFKVSVWLLWLTFAIMVGMVGALSRPRRRSYLPSRTHFGSFRL